MASKIIINDINSIDLSKNNELSFIQIRNIGRVFLNTAKKINNPSIIELGWSNQYFIPIVVNTAFACELLLKALLIRENKQSRKHKLEELFNELNDEMKREIISSVNVDDFQNKLSNISNLFVEWRYLYERPINSIEFGFLCEFSEKLLNITCLKSIN